MSDGRDPDPAGSWAPLDPGAQWAPPPATPGAPPPPPLPAGRGRAAGPGFGLILGGSALAILAVLVVSLVVLMSGGVPMAESYDPPPPAPRTPIPEFTPRESTAPPPTAPIGGPDETLTTEHGVSITVESPSCYRRQGPAGPGDVEQLCSVPVRMDNDSREQIKVSSSDFVLFCGENRYTPDSGASLFFGVPRSSPMDAGTEGLVLLWFEVGDDEIPPTRLEYRRYSVVDTALTVLFPSR